ncbi:hypothetical protein J2X36_004559 [Methylobacterium sp. BE186]|uniref:hypothetical protein n=1 Tax=Methylobacterium sp. BE186 TaxID=2817715 RepID=UPI002859BF78|nr:hypothetical protein [Methylobacterium sp. BE186]MDR7039781.1 hypothetical protein [Methylobacterium sp. BE186]
MSETTNPSFITRLKTRYAANAATPDGACAKKAAIVGSLVGLVLLGGYRLWHRSGSDQAAPTVVNNAAGSPARTFVQGQLPACDAPVAQHLLKQAVETNPSPILGPVKVHKVGAITDYMAFVTALAGGADAKVDPNPDATMLAMRANLESRRSCAAQLFTSRGQHVYNYSIVWTSDAKDEVFLQAELGE